MIYEKGVYRQPFSKVGRELYLKIRGQSISYIEIDRDSSKFVDPLKQFKKF